MKDIVQKIMLYLGTNRHGTAPQIAESIGIADHLVLAALIKLKDAGRVESFTQNNDTIYTLTATGAEEIISCAALDARDAALKKPPSNDMDLLRTDAIYDGQLSGKYRTLDAFFDLANSRGMDLVSDDRDQHRIVFEDREYFVRYDWHQLRDGYYEVRRYTFAMHWQYD